MTKQRQLPCPISDKLPAAKSSVCQVGTPCAPPGGMSPSCPSCLRQGHRPGDTSRKSECIWDVGLSRLLAHIWKPNQNPPKCDLRPQNLDVEKRGPWGMTAACWAAPGTALMAMLIHTTLLPEPDLYKSGQSFSLCPNSCTKSKLFMGDSVVVWDSFAEQNNLKITWNLYWVVSICPP